MCPDLKTSFNFDWTMTFCCVSVNYILSHNRSFFSSLDFIFPLCWAWIRWSCYHLKETVDVEGLSGIYLKWQNWIILLKRKKNFIPILPAFCLICWMMTTLHSTQVHKWTMVMSTTKEVVHTVRDIIFAHAKVTLMYEIVWWHWKTPKFVASYSKDIFSNKPLINLRVQCEKLPLESL